MASKVMSSSSTITTSRQTHRSRKGLVEGERKGRGRGDREGEGRYGVKSNVILAYHHNIKAGTQEQERIRGRRR